MTEHICSTIDDAGFVAILREEIGEPSYHGIIGGPRVNPTGTGLWIDDCNAAAVDRKRFMPIKDGLTYEQNFKSANRPARGFTSDRDSIGAADGAIRNRFGGVDFRWRDAHRERPGPGARGFTRRCLIYDQETETLRERTLIAA